MDFFVFIGCFLLGLLFILARLLLKMPFLTFVGALWIVLFGVWFIASGEKIGVRYELVDNSLNVTQYHEWVWKAYEIELPLMPLSMITFIIVALGVALTEAYFLLRGG